MYFYLRAKSLGGLQRHSPKQDENSNHVQRGEQHHSFSPLLFENERPSGARRASVSRTRIIKELDVGGAFLQAELLAAQVEIESLSLHQLFMTSLLDYSSFF